MGTFFFILHFFFFFLILVKISSIPYTKKNPEKRKNLRPADWPQFRPPAGQATNFFLRVASLQNDSYRYNTPGCVEDIKMPHIKRNVINEIHYYSPRPNGDENHYIVRTCCIHCCGPHNGIGIHMNYLANLKLKGGIVYCSELAWRLIIDMLALINHRSCLQMAIHTDTVTLVKK